MQSNITPRYNKILRFTSGMFRFQERLLKIKKKKILRRRIPSNQMRNNNKILRRVT